jgi:ribosomal protein S18 acetylase RimI-like enzyme
MKINIRNATADDYKGLCELFDEIDAFHRNVLPHIFQKPSGPVREQDYYLGLIADENVGLFIAETDERLVGFVHAIVGDTPAIPVFIPRHYATIDSIVVKSGFMHHGIGKILMDKAQAWAIGKGATSIELNVHEFNEAAISFYENLGYKTFSRRMVKDLKIDKKRCSFE